MNKIILFCIFISIVIKSQTYEWRELPNSPFAGRHDDIHFLNPKLGWGVNSTGQIINTTDGGDTWTVQFQTNSYFRSVKFADSLNGWAGTLNADNVLFRTTNGGETWSLVENIPDPKPLGVCGLSVVGNTIYGSGVYFGPAVVIKSTDKGDTWISKDMSEYATTLIDCRFTTPDSGFVIGGSPNASFADNTVKVVILFTSDGGNTWNTRYTGTTLNEWGWKIVFPSKDIGYVSVERFYSGSVIKTTNGGETWSRLPVPNMTDLEGIGFINPDRGWVGSREKEAYTTNGGATWQVVDIGLQLNRFQFFGDTLGYAAGQRICKYSKVTPTSVERDKIPARSFLLSQNYPNPFNPSTTIEYSLPEASNVLIRIYDGLGKEIFTIKDSYQEQGKHSVVWDGKDNKGNLLSSGPYIYRIDAGKYAESRMMMMLK